MKFHTKYREWILANFDTNFPWKWLREISHEWAFIPVLRIWYYRKTSNTRRTLVGNKIVDHSDVVGASPVGAAPTTSSFST